MTKPDTSNILLGRADIRVANYLSHIDNISPVLGSADSLGQTQDCALNNIREFEVIRNFDSPAPIGRYLTDFGVGLAATILNANTDILAYLFGSDPDNVTNEIRLSPSKFSPDLIKKWRVEAEFVYPNKEDKMVLILPKTSLINPNSLSLVNMDSPENISFEFDQEEVENSSWRGMEFGKIIFDKV